MNYEKWEPVIGLEIHTQLKTRSKMFGPEPNRFGDEPNTNIGFVDTAQPGSLPVINQEAVRKAVQFGCAVRSNISLISRFDRKSYFYPDCPKNFQITQFDHPILRGGIVTCDIEGVTKHFPLNRAHLEEDAGMLKHFTTFAGVDFNRSGVPLLEIVSEACFRSPLEASLYAQTVRSILQFLDASDCNMEEGALRIDANISVRLKGEPGFRNKIEIKNMNSFHNMELALESEIRRQIQFYETHPHEQIKTGTYRFDLETNQTVLMRVKEQAEDYRYFPEPDLPPIVLTESYIEEIRAHLPELPHERYKRYVEKLQIPTQFAVILISDKYLSNYFEEALKVCENGKSLANWITVEFAGRLKESGRSIWDAGILPAHVAELVNLTTQNTITGKIAKSVADDMVANPGKPPAKIVEENPDYLPVHDVSAIEPLVDQVLAENPTSIVDFKAGKTKAFGFLVGQVMKLCRGKASPTVVNDLLTKKLQ